MEAPNKKFKLRNMTPVRLTYRVTHLLADLVDLDSDVPQAVGLYCSCGAAQARQWNTPNPSQPNLDREEMGHPVYRMSYMTEMSKCDESERRGDLRGRRPLHLPRPPDGARGGVQCKHHGRRERDQERKEIPFPTKAMCRVTFFSPAED